MTPFTDARGPPGATVWIIKFVIRGDYRQAGEAILSDEEYAAAEREDTLRGRGAVKGDPGWLGVGRLGRDIRDALRLPEAGPEFIFIVGAEHHEG
jgi:hypothetical protein